MAERDSTYEMLIDEVWGLYLKIGKPAVFVPMDENWCPTLNSDCEAMGIIQDWHQDPFSPNKVGFPRRRG